LPEKRRAVFSLGLFLLTLVVYNPASHNRFVNYDDPDYIVGNKHVLAGLNWETIQWAFQSTEQANWHPITWLSHALDCQLFGLNPVGHHYMSVLLHGLAVVLLFLFLDATTQMPWRSAFVAVLFALHPANVESVAWVAERKNVLCTFFLFLTLLAYRLYAQKPGIRSYLLVLVGFALGLMSKPMLVTLPLVLLLLDYWPLQRTKGVRHSRLILEKIPLFALSAASCLITMSAQSSGAAIKEQFPLANRLQNALIAYVLYLKEAFWPTRLSSFYPHPNEFPAWEVVGSFALLLGLAIAALKLRSKKYIAVGLLWFIGTLVPVIGLVQVGDQAMADRYTYIAFVGIFIAVVWAAADWVQSKRIAWYYPAFASFAVVVALSVLTHAQIGYWNDSTSLWEHSLAVTKNNFVAHDNLAGELMQEGKFSEAAVHLRVASDLNPHDPFSQLNLGVCEQQAGNLDAALSQFQTVLGLTTNAGLRTAAYSNTGTIYRKRGDYPKATENFNAALQLTPEHAFSLTGLGLIAQKQGDLKSAVAYYRRAVSDDPSGIHYLLLSQALKRAGLEPDGAAQTGMEKSPDREAAQAEVTKLLLE